MTALLLRPYDLKSGVFRGRPLPASLLGFRPCHSVDPESVLRAARADLGHDHQIIRAGAEGLPEDHLRDLQFMEAAGTDVVDAQQDCLSQNSGGGARVVRRAEDTLPGK